MAAEDCSNVAASAVPQDLFVSENHSSRRQSGIKITDTHGALVFSVDKRHSESPLGNCNRALTLFDAQGNPLICVHRQDNGSWHGFKVASDGMKDLMFIVSRMPNKFARTELEVFLAGESSELAASVMMMKGCPFQRSCTIYSGDSIVAQTSLMHKLHQMFAPRDRFRLTLFPGFVGHVVLVVALVSTFLYGKQEKNTPPVLLSFLCGN